MDNNEINIFKHNLVPEHIKIDEKEKEKVLEKYNISLLQLPKIKLKDPALASLDVKSGDVIKIIRPSPTNKETIFYRVVVHG